jgi:hypothetical protein
VLSTYLKQSVSLDEAVPGAAIAVHTFGDFQLFNPHLHLIVTDGCFAGGGTFTKGPCPTAKDLMTVFYFFVIQVSCCQKWAKPQLFASYAMSDRSLLVPLLSGSNSDAGQPSWPHYMQWGQDG